MLVTAFVVLAAATAAFVSGITSRNALRDAFRAQGEQQLNSLVAATEDAFYGRDVRSLTDLFEELRDGGIVTFAVAYDADGRVIAEASIGEASPDIEPQAVGLRLVQDDRPIVEWRDDGLFVGRAIRAGGQTLGALALGLSADATLAKIDGVQVRILGVALAVSVAGAFVAVLASISLTRQMRIPSVEAIRRQGRSFDGDRGSAEADGRRVRKIPPVADRSGLVRGALTLAVFLAYAAAYAPLHGRVGIMVGVYGVVPVIVAGLLLGSRFGIGAGVSAHIINFVMLAILQDANWAELLGVRGGLPGFAVYAFIGYIVGRPRDLHVRAKIQENELVRFYDELKFEITAHETKKSALEKERELLTVLMSNIPDLIYFKDQESRYLRINESAAREFGFAGPEEAVGSGSRAILADGDSMDAVRLAEDDRYVIETGRSLVNIERKLRTAGTFGMRWYSTSKAPIRDSTGEVTGLVGISRDITPSKIAAETLTKTASDLRAINAELLAERRRREHQQSQITMLLNASHEGVLLFDSDGRVTWLNDALGHLFGVDRETIRLGDHIDNVREQARSIIGNPEKFFEIVDSGGVDGKSEASGEVEIQGTERHLAFLCRSSRRFH